MIAAINLNLIILEAQIICDQTRLGPLSSFVWVGLVMDGHTVTNLEGFMPLFMFIWKKIVAVFN